MDAHLYSPQKTLAHSVLTLSRARFCQVSELSDSPSTATNSRAASILKRLGVSPSPDLMDRSVKGVVNQVLAMDGLQLSIEVMNACMPVSCHVRLFIGSEFFTAIVSEEP